MKNHFKVLLLTCFVALASISVNAEETEAIITKQKNKEIETYEDRPYSSHFFVEDFLEWEFENDPDAIHNVSNVPIHTRVKGEKVNDSQSTKARVASLAIMNKNTSGTPSQGSTIKEVYNFTNWQYVDVLVAWAGSAGEGIIVPPSSDVTDVAHLNGVPVLGTVFFPPTAYGGKVSWLDEFLVKDENGNFPVADKLIEMANLYGFEGWFINQETSSNSRLHADLFQEFLAYYNNNKPKHQEIMWYDSLISSGSVSWQNQLNSNNEMFFQKGNQRMSDRMFLNFWWNKNMIKNSADKAKSLGRDPFDVYSGIDVQANGPVSGYLPSTLVGENGELMTSLGLYAPDWTLRDGAKEDVEKYWENEKVFWINKSGDPRDTSDKTGWQGISRFFVEKSSVTNMPFVTNFNAGHGDNQFKNGNIIKSGSYNNRSLQDILPTYRWIIDQDENKLEARFGYDEVYTGGSSLKLFGETVKDSKTSIRLYTTDLKVTQNNTASLIYKGDASVNLVLNINGDQVSLSPKTKNDVNGWTEVNYDLSQYNQRNIKGISLDVIATKTSEDSEVHVGEISIIDQNKYFVDEIKNFEIIGKNIQDNVKGNFRLTWDHDGKNVNHFNVYTKSNDSWQYQGSTKNNAYYIENIMRGNTEKLEVKVVAVDLNKNEVPSTESTVSFSFDEIELPSGTFDVSKTFIEVDEEIKLTANASLSTESISWRVDGGTIVDAKDNDATVIFDKSGVYSITMILENSAGTTHVLREKLVLVHDDSLDYELKNLSLDVLDSNVSVSASCNPVTEAGPGSLDGNLKTKWCDNSSETPTMTINLGDVKTLTGFRLHHAEAGGENTEWNTRDYEIHVSLDGETWKKVVHRDDNVDAVSSDSINITEASYVKLVLNKAEQTGNTARIYEFEILGFDERDIQVHPLQNEIHELRTLYYDLIDTLDEYTTASAQELVKLLSKAKEILDNNGENTDSASITKLIDDILESKESLITKVNEKKEELRALIKNLESLDSSKYESESYQELLLVIKEAKALLNEEDTTLEQLDAMILKLEDAMSNLKDYVEKPEEPKEPEDPKEEDKDDSEDTNGSENTEDPKDSEDSKDPEDSKDSEDSKDESNDSDDDKVESGDLPQTGVGPSLLLLSAFTFVIAGLALFVKNKKNQE